MVQVHLAQMHNRLSTEPLINIGSAMAGPEAQVVADGEEGIYLRNKGLGPGRVASVAYFLDRAPGATGTADAVAFDKIADALVKTGIVNSLVTDAPEMDEYIKENEQIKLLLVRSSKVKRDEWIAFLDKRFGMTITYCSIYDDCSTACYRNGRSSIGKACK